ncbi:hypothetical protein [Limnoraphis robusta]|uniref:Uncharacterized protein n=1 Tax=Limnoraphis robusta CCNP1315 TaxID=3110306 RepID=A0ABU5U768_9CYAN|nr:hypothetical protein [Limnoraphis robusta]MEA5522895.1 hypothetical protein [Limnoraphis robusta CCNP1315]MEA5546843.1 hypothetical protein [Limnoraphis robusta CCNP1324]
MLEKLSRSANELKTLLYLLLKDFFTKVNTVPINTGVGTSQLSMALHTSFSINTPMTRAQEVLHLFGSGRFPVLRELENSDGFDVAS